ncbi:MAG TPA: acylneuraminate cytidylyltransferase [Candidatus Methylomirabilis sp.]|nr:acylneuraminate cytidylyltransferase [Candidatus Methylomirabilis sp.]
MGNVVGIIPARGGSVRVPLKNIKLLNGKPLIAYTIETAIESGVLDRIIVSTDHDEIARISKEFGAEVPFMRPADISSDVETELVLQHAVRYLEEVEKYPVDCVVLLQPTSPLRKSETIVKCVDKFRNTEGIDSVATVNNVEGFRPEWMLYVKENEKIIPYNTPFTDDGKPVIKLVARQSFPTLFKQNGVVYVASRDLLMEKQQMIGVNAYAVIIEEEEALDIDTPVDFLVVEKIMRILQENGYASPSLKAEDIELIVYDFDGVMTDNKVTIDQNGNESVIVNRSDGLAVSRFKEMGIEQIIISTEKNPVVQERAKKLGVFCLHSVNDKKDTLEKYLSKKGINKNNVVFIGNDINDLDTLKFIGWPIVPDDAHPDVKNVAKIVTKTCGGCGVIREVLDYFSRL